MGEHEITGHMKIPYTNEIRKLVTSEYVMNTNTLYKNGVPIERRTGITQAFIDSHLAHAGFSLETETHVETRYIKRICGISIVPTPLYTDGTISHLRISVKSKNMRDAINLCDTLAEHITASTGTHVGEHVDIWTRQEEC